MAIGTGPVLAAKVKDLSMAKHRGNGRAVRKINTYHRHNDERPWREKFWEAITFKRFRDAKQSSEGQRRTEVERAAVEFRPYSCPTLF